MEPIFLASVLSYRVVCSWEPECPKRIYVDIVKDGFCSHEKLFEMQKKFYHNPRLERIFNDSRGIMLKATREGAINIIYTKHRDVMAQERQNRLRQLVDGEILRVFKRMKEEGKLQTICVQTEFTYIPKSFPKNGFEERALEWEKREEKIKRIKQMKQAYYERQKFADRPQLLLAWREAAHLGD